LLFSEMKNYKPRPGDADSVMSQALPASMIKFVGLDRKVMACDGESLEWSTRGDKSILDAVVVGIDLLERAGKAPKGLTNKFYSVVAKNPSVALLTQPRLVAQSEKHEPK